MWSLVAGRRASTAFVASLLLVGWLSGAMLMAQTAAAPVDAKTAADARRCFHIDQQIAELPAKVRSGEITAAVRKQHAEALTAERARIVAPYGARTTPAHRALLAEISRLKAEATAREREERAEATRRAREQAAAEQAARREEANAEKLRVKQAAAAALDADVAAVVDHRLHLERDRFYTGLGLPAPGTPAETQAKEQVAQAARSRNTPSGASKANPAFEQRVNDTFRTQLVSQQKIWLTDLLPDPEAVVAPFNGPVERAAALTVVDRFLQIRISNPQPQATLTKLQAYRGARNKLGLSPEKYASLADDRAFQAKVFAASLPQHSKNLLADLKNEQIKLRATLAFAAIASLHLILFLWLPFRWAKRSSASDKTIAKAPPPSPQLPKELQWVELPGLRYPVQLISGQVFDKEVWTETHVSTTTTTTPVAGNPYAVPHTSTSTSVSSTLYHRYWIVTTAGQQTWQRYMDGEFLATPGHRISSVWCGDRSLLAYNHDTKSLACPARWTQAFHRPRFWSIVGGLIVLGAIFGILGSLAPAWAMGVLAIPHLGLSGLLVPWALSSLIFGLIYTTIVSSVITRRRQRHFRAVVVPRFQAFLAAYQPVIPTSVKPAQD